MTRRRSAGHGIGTAPVTAFFRVFSRASLTDTESIDICINRINDLIHEDPPCYRQGQSALSCASSRHHSLLLSMKHLRFDTSEPAVAFPTYDAAGFRSGMEEKWRIRRAALAGRSVSSVSVLV